MTRFNRVLAVFACIGFIFGVCLSVGLIQFGLINFPFVSMPYHWRKVNEYPIEGEPPLHLSIWFRKDGSPVIKQFIQELQDKSRK